MQNKLRVAYLVGTSHSGSTLLSFFADAHPEVFSAGESGLSRESERDPDAYVCSCGSPVTRCELWRNIESRVQAAGLAFSTRHWTNAYHYHQRAAYSLLTTYRGRRWGAVQRAADAWLPGHRGKVARADRVNVEIIRASLELSGKQVFFDGTKVLRRLGRLLEQPELDVRVVRLYRGVRPYVNSMKRFGVPIAEAALHWRRFNETADELLATLPRQRVFELRYEDFCRQPAPTYERLQDFLEVERAPLPEAIVPRRHHVLGNDLRLAESLSVRFDEHWRRSLSPHECQEALNVAGQLPVRLGYVPSGSADPMASLIGDGC